MPRFFSALFVASTLVGASSSQATPAASEPTETIYEGSAIRQLSSQEVAASSLVQTRTRSFIEKENKRARRQLSMKEVRVWVAGETEDRRGDRAEIMAITDMNDKPDSFRLASREKGGQLASVLGIRWESVGEPSGKSLQTGARGEVGDRKYAKRIGGAGRQVYHNPKETLKLAAEVYDFWEKFQPTADRNGWAYNRQSVFSPGEHRLITHQVNVAGPTIRFREWKGNHSVKSGPYNWAPKPSSDCTNRDQKVSFRGAEINVPYVWCDANTILRIDISKSSFGVEWDGKAKNQREVDAAAAFDVHPGSHNLAMSDYIWFTTLECPKSPWSCWGDPGTFEYPYKWTDGGW